MRRPRRRCSTRRIACLGTPARPGGSCRPEMPRRGRSPIAARWSAAAAGRRSCRRTSVRTRSKLPSTCCDQTVHRRPLLVECQARLPDVSADPGQLGPSAPALLVVVIARQPHLVSEPVVAGPREPDFRAIRGIRDDVREIVRARVFGHAHHVDDAWIQRWLRLRIAWLHELLRRAEVRDVLAGGLVLCRRIRAQASRLGVVWLGQQQCRCGPDQGSRGGQSNGRCLNGVIRDQVTARRSRERQFSGLARF